MNIIEVLDIAKDKTGSDQETAKAINVHGANLSKWRKGEREPTNQQCMDLATLIGVHWSVVVKASEIAAALRRGEPEQAARWERVSTVQGALVAILMGVALFAPGDASAYTNQLTSCFSTQYTLWVYRTKRFAGRWLRHLTAFAAGLRPTPLGHGRSLVNAI